MPELPEVETVVRGLTKHIIGQTIKDVVVLNKKSVKPSVHKSISLSVLGVARRGKAIIIELTKGISLLIHLKMTGQLIYVFRSGSPMSERSASGSRMTKKERHSRVGGNPDRLNLGHPTDDFSNTMPSKHTRVILKLSKGTLYFNDQRLFGWVKVLPTKEVKNDSFISKLGPDALDISTARLWAVTKRYLKSSIKAILLDQSVITGLGNIYTDEVLFEAKIKPTRKGKTITQKDAGRLIKAIKKVLTKGIKYSGTSIVNYKTPEGSPGRMQNYLKVYSRAGLPCKVCQTPISKIRLAGRGTHYCKKCQS